MGESIDLNLFTKSDTTTLGVNSIKSIDDYELGQNYQNPFNRTTNISFYIPSRSFVSLPVIDVLGREVPAIVSEEMLVGTDSQEWNTVGFPSGVYVYRLQSGSFTETKNIILEK